MLRENHKGDDPGNQNILTYFSRLANGEVFLNKDTKGYINTKLENVWVNKCYSCNRFTVWVQCNAIYPHAYQIGEANNDLPEDIRGDYDEARAVLEASPRSAAALLRLCIQKICISLGEKGANLNDDIANLVKKGLDVRVQQALDIVRVAGNNAVHPGKMDLRDDKEAATSLFQLVNLIADRMISEPKQIDVLFNRLPQNARAQIVKRGK